MTEQEMLECEKYWCENCSNFDKDHIGPDACALCKITNILTYSEMYAKDCLCRNVAPEAVASFRDNYFEELQRANDSCPYGPDPCGRSGDTVDGIRVCSNCIVYFDFLTRITPDEDRDPDEGSFGYESADDV